MFAAKSLPDPLARCMDLCFYATGYSDQCDVFQLSTINPSLFGMWLEYLAPAGSQVAMGYDLSSGRLY